MELGRFDMPGSKLVFLGGNFATLDGLENGRFALPRGSCGLSQAVCHGVSYRSSETIGNYFPIFSIETLLEGIIPEFSVICAIKYSPYWPRRRGIGWADALSP